MSLTDYNSFISRISAGYSRTETIWVHQPTNYSTFGNKQVATSVFSTPTKVVPTLESGVTAYIPTYASVTATSGGGGKSVSLMLCKLVNLGSLDLSTPTFTDGSSMGTRTELGSTADIASPVFFEVTSALNATPGTFTITYVDQDGNSAETTAAHTPTASAAAGSGGFAILNTGDWGVRDITNATRTGGTAPSGVIKFWGVVPLGIASCASSAAEFEFFNKGLSTVKLGAGDQLGIVQLSNSTLTTGTFTGTVTYVGDN